MVQILACDSVCNFQWKLLKDFLHCETHHGKFLQRRYDNSKFYLLVITLKDLNDIGAVSQ